MVLPRNSDHFVEERLDRCLVSQDWLSVFSNAFLSCFIVVLDHHPLLLELNPSVNNSRLHHFRFESCWLQEMDFVQTVEKVWNVAGDIPFQDRVRRCIEDMSGWSKTFRLQFCTRIRDVKFYLQRAMLQLINGDHDTVTELRAELHKQKTLIGNVPRFFG